MQKTVQGMKKLIQCRYNTRYFFEILQNNENKQFIMPVLTRRLAV